MPRFALAKHHIALAAGSGIPSADDQIGQTIAIDIARTGDAAARVVKAINAVDPKSACAEIAEIEAEDRSLHEQLKNESLTEIERTKIKSQLSVHDARWLLAQFEGFRVLNSVTELRFIHSNTEIQNLTRNRLVSVVDETFARGHAALGHAIIATYLERADEGTLTSHLSPEDILRLRNLGKKADPDLPLP